jgi:actin-related protein 5
MPEPYIDRPNVISRYKERKLGRTNLLFGRDCEADANSRSNARTMFDGDLLVHGELLVSTSVSMPS